MKYFILWLITVVVLAVVIPQLAIVAVLVGVGVYLYLDERDV